MAEARGLRSTEQRSFSRAQSLKPPQKDRGITTGTLFDKIEDITRQGFIRPHIAEAAHEARHLGNDMAHGAFDGDIEAQDAEDALVIMDDILLEVYQSPAHTKALRDRRAARKQAEQNQ